MNLSIDLNTVLTSITLASILYVAATLRRLDKDQALTALRAQQQEKEMIDLRARVTSTEADVEALKITMARFHSSAFTDQKK